MDEFPNALKPLICKKQGKCGCYSDATPAYNGSVWNISENSTVRLGAHWQLNSCGDTSIMSMIPNNMNKKINIFFFKFLLSWKLTPVRDDIYREKGAL